MRAVAFSTAEHYGTRKRAHEEDDLQANLIEHIKWRAVPGLVYYMIRNHGKRSVAALKKDAAMGLRKGASDLGFIIPPHGQAAMLELKYGTNTPTPEQEQFGIDAEAAGAFYACVWDIDSAIGVLTAWGALKPER